MYRKIVISLALLGMCLFLLSCSKSNSNSESQEPSPTAAPSAAAPEEDPILKQIAQMSLEEKLGQMVIVGVEGTTMDTHAADMIKNHHVGGFIFYKDNIISASQTVDFINQLREANSASSGVPLWLSLDQEGGRVSRMPNDFVLLPTAQAVGLQDQVAYTQRIGQALGMETRALGFNMDFAPVLDINSNPKNPVIGDRSFGAEPQAVIKHGIETMKAIQAEHVIPVVKHFPGHGDTSVDSHLELPVVDKSLEELQAFELLPFAEAVKEGADAVMVAHILFPQIDASNPASLSNKLINGLLRDKLNFDGVVITDDMTMGGIVNNNDIGEAAVRSVKAGSDILLVGHNDEDQLKVLQALEQGVEGGGLSENDIDTCVARILKLKTKYSLDNTAVEPADVQAINQQLNSALSQH